MTRQTKIRLWWLVLIIYAIGLVINLTVPARHPAEWWFVPVMSAIAVIVLIRLWHEYHKPRNN